MSFGFVRESIQDKMLNVSDRNNPRASINNHFYNTTYQIIKKMTKDARQELHV